MQNLLPGFIFIIDCYDLDPCNSYTVDNDYRRSSAYILQQNDSARCDSYLKEGWYRFTSEAGGVMPTKCPEENACGMFELVKYFLRIKV